VIFDRRRDMAGATAMTRERPKVNQEHGRAVKIVVDRKSIFACTVGILICAGVMMDLKMERMKR
jgi:hypothetical protein